MSRILVAKCPKCGSTRIDHGQCQFCGHLVSPAVEPARAPEAVKVHPVTAAAPAPETTRKRAKKQAVVSSNLIPCPDCGRMVSKDALTCPQCGRKLPREKEKMICPDCGSSINADVLSCPQCGCPFPGNEKRTSSGPIVVEHRRGFSIFWFIVIFVIVFLTSWYLISPYSTPVWLQQIGGTIRCFFTGETSYKIFDPSKIGK